MEEEAKYIKKQGAESVEPNPFFELTNEEGKFNLTPESLQTALEQWYDKILRNRWGQKITKGHTPNYISNFRDQFIERNNQMASLLNGLTPEQVQLLADFFNTISQPPPSKNENPQPAAATSIRNEISPK